MKNRCNSQQQQSYSDLKQLVCALQQREASYRLDISKLRKQLQEKSQQYLEALKVIAELKRIQKRDGEYFAKIDQYVSKLKQQLREAKKRAIQLERQGQGESQESIRTSQIFRTESSFTQSEEKKRPEPKQFKLNVRMIPNLANPYPNTSFTENLEIFGNCKSSESIQHSGCGQQGSSDQAGRAPVSLKPSSLQEQIMQRILDKQDTFFTCNSQQSNFSFANSDHKKYNSADQQQSRSSSKSFNYSSQQEDKENNFRWCNN